MYVLPKYLGVVVKTALLENYQSDLNDNVVCRRPGKLGLLSHRVGRRPGAAVGIGDLQVRKVSRNPTSP